MKAATGRDYTLVYMRVLDELVDRAYPVMSDMLCRPGFYDLDQEREVVLEEIAMYEDDPQDTVHDLLTSAIFPGQALGRPVIGTAEVIGSIPKDGISDYHRHHYRAPNMVVSAAGNITHDELLDLSERLMGGIGAGGEPAVFEAAAAGSPTMTIREKRGLAYSVGSYAVGYADAGQVAVHLGTRGDNLGTACEVIGNELRKLGDNAVPEQELRRAKDHLKGRLVLSTESPGSRMNRIGRAMVTDTEMLTIDEIIDRAEAVTAADIQALAQEFWQPESFSVAAIGPDESEIRKGLARLTA